jgi:hypothetical protein
MRGAWVGILLVLGVPSLAHAEPVPEAPAAQPPATPPERKSYSQWGIGPAYAAVYPGAGSQSAAASGLGVALEFARMKPVSERADVSFRFAWGLTAWDRFRRWSGAAYDIGAWTTEAYRDVYGWMGKRSSADDAPHGDGDADGKKSDPTQVFRIAGGSIAMVFLALGYVASGFTYAASVIAPTTWMEIDVAGNYNLGDKTFNPYLKGGLGMMAFLHPEHGTLVGGVGPHFGGGLRVGSFLHLGLSATWSPPPLHGEARSGRSHLLVGSFTVGTQH